MIQVIPMSVVVNKKYQSQQDCQVLSRSLLATVEKLTEGQRQLQLPRVAQGRKNPLWMGLAERLHQARKCAGLSQTQLARFALLTHRVIGRTEAQIQAPSLESVEKLAAGLGISVCWLAYGHEGDQPFQKKRPRSPLPPEDPVPMPGAGHFTERFRGSGERIRQIREQRGLSIRHTARLATEKIEGLKLAEPRIVSYQSVLYTETGATLPLVDTVEYIAMALDVAPAWLAFGDEEPLDHVRNLDQVSSSPLDEKATQRDGK